MKSYKSNLFLKQTNYCIEMSQYLIVEINFLLLRNKRSSWNIRFDRGHNCQNHNSPYPDCRRLVQWATIVWNFFYDHPNKLYKNLFCSKWSLFQRHVFSST
jgi:hypothetical protein